MEWVLLALVLWGAWGFLPKLATSAVSPEEAFTFEVAGGVIVAVWLIGRHAMTLHLEGVALAYAAGLCSYLGVYIYIGILSRGAPAGITAALCGLYPLVSVMLAMMFLGERPTWTRGLGIALGGVALYLLSVPGDSRQRAGGKEPGG